MGIIMEPSSVFISNLSKTCTGSSYIKENGKKLGIFERIADFFHGKHNYDHFKAVCEKLPENCTDISQDKQIEILGRIREIQKKIKNETVKQECEVHINRFESHVLTKENLDACTKKIFEEILDASERPNRKKNKSCFRQLETLIDHYSNDPDGLEKILSNYNNFYPKFLKLYQADRKRERDTMYFSLFNQKINQKLRAQEGILNHDHSSIVHQPKLFAAFFVFKCHNSSSKGFQDHISALKNLMETHSDDPEFIQNCLTSTNTFLKHIMSPLPSEEKKNDYLRLQGLFPLVNKYIPAIEDSSLALELKTYLGNLPTIQDRTAFSNLTLSENDQLHILTNTLQLKEDALTDQLVTDLETKSPKNPYILTKLVSPRSNLSDTNRLKLRNALEGRLNEIPENWDHFLDVKYHLEQTFLLDENSNHISSLEDLKRTSKAKSFFKDQLDLDDNMIFIPRWHHVTSEENLGKILNSGEIQVRHERAYRGAWISSTREPRFGSHSIVLSHKVAKLDPHAFIGYKYDDRRWRGIQRAIPLTPDHGGIAIGVPSKGDKTARKIEKMRLVRILQEKGFPDPKALSINQLDFTQKQVKEILGNINLSNAWW